MIAVRIQVEFNTPSWCGYVTGLYHCRYARHHRRVDEPEVIGRDSDDEYDHRAGGSESDEDEEDIDEEASRDPIL